MRGRPGLEWIGAVAGLALMVVVFLPWWELDVSRSSGGQQLGPNVLSYLDLAAGDTTASAWDAVPRVSAVLIATGVLALAVPVASYLGAGVLARRWLLTAATAASVVALALVAFRLVDKPYESFSAQPAAYAGLAAVVVLAACTVTALRTSAAARPAHPA